MPGTYANLSPVAGSTANLVGLGVATLLTLVVLSYVLGDNPLFRWAQYAFVGLAAGYAGSVAWHHVLWPRLSLLIEQPAAYWYYGLFFALGLALLARGIRPISSVADLPLGIMVGTGAGLALGGALTGTLVPQLQAAIVSINPTDHGDGTMGWLLATDALLALVVTIAVLVAFHYTASGRGLIGKAANRLLASVGALGQRTITLGMGVLLAGALLSFLALLSSRIDFLAKSWQFLRLGMGF